METPKTSGQLELERRRQMNRIVIADLSVCHHCKRTNLAEDEAFCPNCGFPQRGDESSQRRFLAKFNIDKMQQGEYEAAVNKARNILYIVGGLNLLSGILLMAVNNDMANLIAGIIVALAFVGLALWSRTRPFPAILTGFIVYITLLVLGAILNPVSIVSGIIWKIAIISGFVYGYRGAKEAEHIKEQMELKENGATSNL